MLFASRRIAITSLLISICSFTQLAKLDFNIITMSAYRLIVLAGIIRILIRKEPISGGITKLDKLMIAYSIITFLTGSILKPNFSGIVNRGGFAFDIIGLYLLSRCLIANKEDFIYCLRSFGFVFIPLSLVLIYEKLTGNNLLSEFSLQPIPLIIRSNKIRATGPFLHPILAGSFMAVSFPYIVSLWWQGKANRKVCILCAISVILGIFATASSGPIMALLMSIIGYCFWKLREKMKMIRWCLIIGIIVLHIFMKAPVWYIIAKIDLTGSSTGWHRAELITSAINHFNEWWLIGTNYTRHWMPYGINSDPNHTDITNQYLLIGINGGILLLALFIYIQLLCFRNIGTYLRVKHNASQADQMLVWAIGASLFSQVVTFFSIPFFDQSIAIVYLTFAFGSFIITRINLESGVEPMYV